MLTEDAVLDAVQAHLEQRGWETVNRARATERGIDLAAVRPGVRIEVEAKGAGSSKERSARYGSEFNRGQVFDHVAKAVLKALRVVSGSDALAAVALPDNADHRREIDQVSRALQRQKIGVFWVSEDGEVTLEAPWEV